MTDRFDPISARASLTGQLRQKSRARRDQFDRLAAAPVVVSPRNDLLPRLELSYIALGEVRASPRKIRKLDPAHVREIASSIRVLGFCAPILIGGEKDIIDGEARFEAAKQLGLAQIPCISIAHLNKIEQRTLRLAVNRIAEKGEWDLAALKIELGELMLNDAPIEIAGFSPAEMDQIVLDGGDAGVERGPIAPDPSGTAVARVGDVFALGVHRVVCGDARRPEVLRALMHISDRVRLVLTDEPYNVKICGNVTGGSHREFAMASGEMSDAEFLSFNLAWMGAVLPYLHDGAVFGTFIDWRGYPTVFSAATKLGLTPLNLVVWAKTNGGMGSLYRSQHELLPLFKSGSGAHTNNVELGRHGRWRSNVWSYPGASSMGSDARRGLADHPTVKPSAMLADALLDLTRLGDIVLDPFLGSGSTLVAAENTGRVCLGVELDPLYVDVVVRRYETLTGKSAMLVETGEMFSELSIRRAAALEAEESPGTVCP
jgi:DNA modification methylase